MGRQVMVVWAVMVAMGSGTEAGGRAGLFSSALNTGRTPRTRGLSQGRLAPAFCAFCGRKEGIFLPSLPASGRLYIHHRSLETQFYFLPAIPTDSHGVCWGSCWPFHLSNLPHLPAITTLTSIDHSPSIFCDFGGLMFSQNNPSFSGPLLNEYQ